MKTLKAVSFLFLFSSLAYAHVDTSQNPDKFPSLGLDYTHTQTGLTGPVQEIFDPSNQKVSWSQGQGNLTLNQILVDFRAPLSNTLTFTVHGGPNVAESFGNSESGYSVGAGVRLYLPGLAN